MSLGAILLLIYNYNFFNGHFNGNSTYFADDTALSYKKEGWEEVRQDMQQDLNATVGVEGWRKWFVFVNCQVLDCRNETSD